MSLLKPATHRGVSHTVIVVSSLVVVTPVFGKRNHEPAAAEDGKSEQEINNRSTTIQSSGQNVVVFDEPVGPILA